MMGTSGGSPAGENRVDVLPNIPDCRPERLWMRGPKGQPFTGFFRSRGHSHRVSLSPLHFLRPSGMNPSPAPGTGYLPQINIERTRTPGNPSERAMNQR